MRRDSNKPHIIVNVLAHRRYNCVSQRAERGVSHVMTKVSQREFARRERQSQDAQHEKVVWGATAIAEIIGRSEKSVFHMLTARKLPGARQVGGRWCFSPRVFFATFETAE
jgi:hypothetical protein